ncbi:VOC family protein [Rhodococcus koreensis]|uniref:Glyoxalase-like domain-containing protein n=1 Tax=Rhodococcus koreensis TaxID=99653 RepID=A0A1H4L200_9NOCA|nr:VOC family protein [Rhodococcus koreensis]SEB64345.1 Glyoxalase-like domain-containing protein [Rhodococcus koreensis]
MEINARLTQVATLVGDLDKADAQVRDLFGFEEGYHESGMAMFGLENTVQPIGERQYLEVCGQLREGESQRPVGGRRGNGGYMAIVEVSRREDIALCRQRLAAQGLRVVHEIVQDEYESIHVHPRDLGTIVSFDWNGGPWPGIAADWQGPIRTDVITAIAGIELRSASPDEYAKRWATVLGLDVENGVVTLPGDGSTVRFAGGRSDDEAGLDVIDFVATARTRAGESHDIGGTEFRLV